METRFHNTGRQCSFGGGRVADSPVTGWRLRLPEAGHAGKVNLRHTGKLFHLVAIVGPVARLGRQLFASAASLE